MPKKQQALDALRTYAGLPEIAQMLQHGTVVLSAASKQCRADSAGARAYQMNSTTLRSNCFLECVYLRMRLSKMVLKGATAVRNPLATK